MFHGGGFLPEIRRGIILRCQSPEIAPSKKLNAIFVMIMCAILLFLPTAAM